MRETYLHYVWEKRLFNPLNLYSVKHEKIEIISTGKYNRESGPDFTNALIKINGILWSGNVELHLKTSLWKKHRHDQDPAYENVILHVVYEHDEEIYTNSCRQLTTLELKPILKNPFIFNSIQKAPSTTLPCATQLSSLEKTEIEKWIQYCAIERCHQKTHQLISIINSSHKQLQEISILHLAKYIGGPANEISFNTLIQQLPFEIASRHRDQVIDLIALYLGQSGLLNSLKWEKEKAFLYQIYNHLKRKYQLKEMSESNWKTGGIRPHNQPVNRIMQLAFLTYCELNTFYAKSETHSLSQIKNRLTKIHLDIKDELHNAGLFSCWKTLVPGNQTNSVLAINVIIPFHILKYHFRTPSNFISYHHELKKLPPEKNRITEYYKKLGIPVRNALESQGIIHLNKYYCQKKKCLHCTIGLKLIHPNNI